MAWPKSASIRSSRSSTTPILTTTCKARSARLPLPNLGYHQEKRQWPWAWGIGAFVPAGFGASYGVMNEPATGANLLRSQGGMAKLLPALSFRATERLSLGISVGIGFSYASLDGPLYLQIGRAGRRAVDSGHGRHRRGAGRFGGHAIPPDRKHDDRRHLHRAKQLLVARRHQCHVAARVRAGKSFRQQDASSNGRARWPWASSTTFARTAESRPT